MSGPPMALPCCCLLLLLVAIGGGCPSPGSAEEPFNSAPRLTLDTPRADSRLDDATAVEVSGYVWDREDALDTGTADAIALDVAVDGIEGVTGVANADGTFTLSATLAAGEHTLAVTATDAGGASSGVTIPVRVVAATQVPPTAPQIRIDPADPVAGGALTLVIDVPAEDPNGDDVTTVALWSSTGSQPAITGDTVGEGVTVANETWTVTVVASDGLQESAPVSASVLIGEGSAFVGDEAAGGPVYIPRGPVAGERVADPFLSGGRP